FGVAVQEYDGWTAARGQILHRHSIRGCRADSDRRTRFGSLLRAGRDGQSHECQNKREYADPVPPCHETLLNVNVAIALDCDCRLLRRSGRFYVVCERASIHEAMSVITVSLPRSLRRS